MNGIYQGLREVQAFLERHGIRYMVIGGIGAIAWGEPRTTVDIDIKIDLSDDRLDWFIKKVAAEFKIPVDRPKEFARKLQVLPIETKEGARADLIFAGLDYEKQALERAVEVEIIKGCPVKLATAEDIIIQKAISPREKDWSDIEGIVFRRGRLLDRKYVLKWLRELAAILDRPEIVKRLERMLRQRGR